MSDNPTLDLLDAAGPMIESGINQLSHPNPHVRARLVEHSVSGCPNGCKYYQDPKFKILILAHSASYGCKRTKNQIQMEKDAVEFAGRNVWMIQLKDRFDQEVWDALAFKAVGNEAIQIGENTKSAFEQLTNVKI